MATMTCPEPPDRPTYPPDQVDEIDVDLDGDLDLPVPARDPCDTLPEGMEYLGSYASIRAYLRAMLEPEVAPACVWILDHLDFEAVQRRWESDGSRLMIERGHVYRLAEGLADQTGHTATSEDE